MNAFCHTVFCKLPICPQVGVRVLADNNSWNVNGTTKPQNCWEDAQSTEIAGF